MIFELIQVWLTYLHLHAWCSTADTKERYAIVGKITFEVIMVTSARIHDCQHLREPFFVYQFNEVDNGSINISLANSLIKLQMLWPLLQPSWCATLFILRLEWRTQKTSKRSQLKESKKDHNFRICRECLNHRALRSFKIKLLFSSLYNNVHLWKSKRRGSNN